MAVLVQFIIGLIFGGGLIVSGMSDPAKVLNFLDLAAIPKGTWDPSLAFVMAGAVAVTFVGFRAVFKRPKPLFASQFHLPAAKGLNAGIIYGPAIFGVGWGLAGFCPGPAFTAIASGSAAALTFVSAMLAGMILARQLADRAPFVRTGIPSS
jgi:uncharacterized membrane protein YedE/YeeE